MCFTCKTTLENNGPTSFAEYTTVQKIWRDCPSELSHCKWIGRFLVRTPLSAWPGLGTQSRYEAHHELQVEHRQK